MKGMGWTLIVVAVVLLVWACFTPTSIHTEMKYVEGLGMQDATDVLNLGLLQTQMMLLETGLAFFLAGTVAVCVGELRDSMIRADTAKPALTIEPEIA